MHREAFGLAGCPTNQRVVNKQGCLILRKGVQITCENVKRVRGNLRQAKSRDLRVPHVDAIFEVAIIENLVSSCRQAAWCNHIVISISPFGAPAPSAFGNSAAPLSSVPHRHPSPNNNNNPQ